MRFPHKTKYHVTQKFINQHFYRLFKHTQTWSWRYNMTRFVWNLKIYCYILFTMNMYIILWHDVFYLLCEGNALRFCLENPNRKWPKPVLFWKPWPDVWLLLMWLTAASLTCGPPVNEWHHAGCCRSPSATWRLRALTVGQTCVYGAAVKLQSVRAAR